MPTYGDFGPSNCARLQHSKLVRPRRGRESTAWLEKASGSSLPPQFIISPQRPHELLQRCSLVPQDHALGSSEGPCHI